MRSPIILIILVVALSCYSIQAERILGIFPFPGPSQYIFPQPYFKALAARGHDVTVINSFPQKQKIPNFRDIYVQFEGYEDFLNGTVNGDDSSMMEFYSTFFENITLIVLDNPEVKDLLFSGKEHFDLVIVEALLIESIYAIAPHFGAKLIGISTFGTDQIIDELVGNSSPLSYIPLVTSSFTDNMNFWERLQNLGLAAIERFYLSSHFKSQEALYKKYFPHLPYELDEIRRNFSLVLLNQHFSMSFARPYVPNMIEVGGMHISNKTKPLPKEIDDFINGAEHGVIYFSLGSNIKSIHLNAKKLEAIMKVFASLKERILWKFEKPELDNKPANVLISKWFPQSDILAHPKVKLFITHAGLLSTMEAIYHAKPVVGIPVFYDQFLNIERAKNMGFGRMVSFTNLNEKDLKAEILEILNNKSYTETAQKASKRHHDQPMKPLDIAIFWTEYVLRHDGAAHMRVSGRNLSFVQFYSLDTLGFVFIVLSLSITIIVFILKCLVKKLAKFFNPNPKSKSE